MISGVQIHEAAAGEEAILSLIGAATFLESFAGVLDGADILAHCQKQHAPEVYACWLADDKYKAWLALASAGGAPVGYLILGPADLPLVDPDPRDCEIKRVYLLSRYQGGGVGRELVQRAIDEAKSCGARRVLLGVYSGNERAIGFYQRLGFATVGTRRFRVGYREYDDLILGLRLDAGKP
jgi:ribosomal protein S18 acetylase RimI-like enzyme